MHSSTFEASPHNELVARLYDTAGGTQFESAKLPIARTRASCHEAIMAGAGGVVQLEL